MIAPTVASGERWCMFFPFLFFVSSKYAAKYKIVILKNQAKNKKAFQWFEHFERLYQFWS
jgi:hypothetical protein